MPLTKGATSPHLVGGAARWLPAATEVCVTCDNTCQLKLPRTARLSNTNADQLLMFMCCLGPLRGSPTDRVTSGYTGSATVVRFRYHALPQRSVSAYIECKKASDTGADFLRR
jgi:hypothetical protein